MTKYLINLIIELDIHFLHHFFPDVKIWTDATRSHSTWYHDGGDEVTYDWSINAYLSGDGPCLEFTYLKDEEKGLFNDLSCADHSRLYICQYLTTPSM